LKVESRKNPGSEVLEEIDGGEDDDPDDVDEVPVEADRLDIDGVFSSNSTAPRLRPNQMRAA